MWPCTTLTCKHSTKHVISRQFNVKTIKYVYMYECYVVNPIIKPKRLNRKSSPIILSRKITANNDHRHKFVAFIYRFKYVIVIKKKKILRAYVCKFVKLVVFYDGYR